MKAAFQVSAYWKDGVLYSDIPINQDALKELQTDKSGMVLIGRALTGFSTKDTLYMRSGDPVMPVTFRFYGRNMDSVDGGCTCMMLCTPYPHAAFRKNDILYLREI